MFYDGYHFFGMHLFWWFFWILFFFMLFGLFEPPVPKKRKGQDALEILQKRFAAGSISKEEYAEHKAILEKDRRKSD